MINCNEVKQLADSLVNLPPDGLYEDSGNASSPLVSWQPLVHTLNITSHSLIGLLETHFLAIRTENIFFICVREHGLFVTYRNIWLMLINYHWLICRQGWISDSKSHIEAFVLLNFERIWLKVRCRYSNWPQNGKLRAFCFYTSHTGPASNLGLKTESGRDSVRIIRTTHLRTSTFPLYFSLCCCFGNGKPFRCEWTGVNC